MFRNTCGAAGGVGAVGVGPSFPPQPARNSVNAAPCHLSVIHAKEGQLIAAGEHIADVGNTGLSTGAHLHWEMASQGVLIDALRFTDGTNGF